MAIYSEVGHVVLNTEHGIYPTADSEVAEVTAETKEEGYATHRWVYPSQTLHQSQFNIKTQPQKEAFVNIHIGLLMLFHQITSRERNSLCHLSIIDTERSRSWYITQSKTGQALHAS